MLRCRIHGLSLVRIIVLLVVLLILLQLLHMSLLSRLEAKGGTYKHERYVDKRGQHKNGYSDTWLRMKKKLDNTHVLDQSGEYRVLDNFVRPGETDNSHIVSDVRDKLRYFNVDTNGFDVSIVTHTSSQHLLDLVGLSELFRGPISVSVFTWGSDITNCLQTIAYLHLCNEHIKKYVNFHLVYPLGHLPKNLNTSIFPTEAMCDRTMDSVSVKTEKNYANSGVKYPHNLLRNLAIKYTTTSYVLVTDIDIVPSKSLRSEFYKFIQTHNSNETDTDFTAFVLPVFEVESDSRLPRNKEELLQSWDANSARPFYRDVCWKCQRHTNYERWKLVRTPGDSGLHVSYYLEWKDPWEPFYIAKRNLPLYDERFKQYGFNRISQVCELHIAGFTFAVLDNAFLLHQGFKNAQDFHATKEKELNENRILFRQFKEELKTKYPESGRRCV